MWTITTPPPSPPVLSNPLPVSATAARAELGQAASGQSL